MNIRIDPTSPSDVKTWNIEFYAYLDNYGVQTASSPVSQLTLTIQCPVAPSLRIGTIATFDDPIDYILDSGAHYLSTSEVIDDFDGICPYNLETKEF